MAGSPPTSSVPSQALPVPPQLAERAGSVDMHGSWAVMLAFPHSLQLSFDGAFVHESPLAWIARNSSKPDRPQELETWILHASPAWSGRHIEESPEDVAALLIDEFWRVTQVTPTRIQYSTAHRWRYALPPEPLTETCLLDSQMQVGACGDWCAGPRVEGAFLSGMAAAGRVMGLLNPERPPKVYGGTH